MNCYYHQDTVAVGICRSCGRALCVASITDINGLIACKDHCEKQVEYINKALPRKYNYLLSMLLSAGFLLYGLYALNQNNKAAVATGYLFIFMAVISFTSVILRKVKK